MTDKEKPAIDKADIARFFDRCMRQNDDAIAARMGYSDEQNQHVSAEPCPICRKPPMVYCDMAHACTGCGIIANYMAWHVLPRDKDYAAAPWETEKPAPKDGTLILAMREGLAHIVQWESKDEWWVYHSAFAGHKNQPPMVMSGNPDCWAKINLPETSNE